MKHSQRKHLLLGTSFLALSILSFPAQGLAALCPGEQDAQCLNHKGLPVADSYCLPDTTGTKAGAKPAPLAGCTYNCPPPPTYHGSSGDGDGGSSGGGWLDTNGDGLGDTHISDMPGGSHGASSSSQGGSTNDGTSHIDNYGNYGGNVDGGSNGWSPSGDGGDGGGSGDGGGDGGGYSCMVVTHFYRRGLFTKKEWLVNKKDALSGRLSKPTIDGYHVWAPYAVLAMRKQPWLEKIFFNLFMARTRVLEFEQGRCDKITVKDRLSRILLETPSVLLGALGFKPDHNYNFERIYGTHQDVALRFNQFYVKQPQGMIGW